MIDSLLRTECPPANLTLTQVKNCNPVQRTSIHTVDVLTRYGLLYLTELAAHTTKLLGHLTYVNIGAIRL